MLHVRNFLSFLLRWARWWVVHFLDGLSKDMCPDAVGLYGASVAFGLVAPLATLLVLSETTEFNGFLLGIIAFVIYLLVGLIFSIIMKDMFSHERIFD